MQPLFELLARQTGDQKAGSALQLLDGFRQQLGEELDLRNEARALAHFRRLGAEFDLPLLVVPEPLPASCRGPTCSPWSTCAACPSTTWPGWPSSATTRRPWSSRWCGGFWSPPCGGGPSTATCTPATCSCSRTGGWGSSTGASSGRLDHDTHRFFLRLLEGVLGDEAAWPDITAHLTRTYGRAIKEAAGPRRRAADRVLPQPDRAHAHPAVRRGQPGRAVRRAPAPGGTGPGIQAHRAAAAGDLAPAAGPAPDAPDGRRGRRAHVGVRPGDLPAGQAAHVLRALRQDVPLRRPAPGRPRSSCSPLLAGVDPVAEAAGPVAGRNWNVFYFSRPRPAAGRSTTRRVERASTRWTPDEEVLTSDHVLEYPYSRSVGPVIGAFLTGPARREDPRGHGRRPAGSSCRRPSTTRQPPSPPASWSRSGPGHGRVAGPGWAPRCPAPAGPAVRLGAGPARRGRHGTAPRPRRRRPPRRCPPGCGCGRSSRRRRAGRADPGHPGVRPVGAAA